MIKVSVIIPIYNVEKYLSKCLDSIVNQSLKEIEIICINDCSTDSSLSILHNYSKKDSRIKIINNKINYGVGYNRNLGIKEAIGEYITFIDSDDYISLNFLEKLYNTAKKYDVDIVNTLNIFRVSDNKITKFLYYFSNCKIEYKSDFSFSKVENFDSIENIILYIWNKLYRRDFIIKNDIYFFNTKLGAAEDADFIFRLMAYRPNIAFNNKAIYYYRYLNSSLSNSIQKSINYTLSCFENIKNTLLFYQKYFPNDLDNIYHKIWYPILNYYNGNSNEVKKELYHIILNFAYLLKIKENTINKKSKYDDYAYNEYLALISSINYENYLFNKYLLSKTSEIHKETLYKDNYFRLFAINNSSYYINIIVFGIKISIKKIKI